MMNMLIGSTVASKIKPTHSMAEANPSVRISISKKGTPAMPPTLAPSNAVETARP